MITGDNKRTAEAICRNIGVFGERERTDGLSYEGEELMKMTKVRCQVARASPASPRMLVPDEASTNLS